MNRPIKEQDPIKDAHHWIDQKYFVAARLRWVGTIQRKDIQNRFNVTFQTASTILKRYLNEIGGLQYDSSRKCYVFTKETETTKAISLHEAWHKNALINENPTCTETINVREPDANATRAVLQAKNQNGCIRIKYLGTRKTSDAYRWITPTQLVWDGERWHIRAYCHTAQGYRNFVLARIAEAITEKPREIPPDTEWQETETLQLQINPSAKPEAQAAWRLEYQTTNDQLELTIRKANRITTRTKLGLDPSDKPFTENIKTEEPKI